jgi:hypothetical protein
LLDQIVLMTSASFNDVSLLLDQIVLMTSADDDHGFLVSSLFARFLVKATNTLNASSQPRALPIHTRRGSGGKDLDTKTIK